MGIVICGSGEEYHLGSMRCSLEVKNLKLLLLGISAFTCGALRYGFAKPESTQVRLASEN